MKNFKNVKVIYFNSQKGGMHEYAKLMKEGYDSNSILASIESFHNSDYSNLLLFFKLLVTKKNKVYQWLNKLNINENTLLHFSDIALFIYPLIFRLLKKYDNCIVITLHDPVPHGEEEFIKKVRNAVIYLLNKLLVHLSYKFDNLFIHIHSNDQKISKRGKYIIARHPISDRSLEYREITKIDSNQKINFLFIGRLEYYKGVDLYVEAANNFLNLNSDKHQVTFTLAGRGNLNPKQDYSKIKVINKFIATDQFNSLIEKSHVVVLPYINATQSGVLNSAIQFNKPVIVAKAGDLPKYVIENETGLILNELTTDEIVRSFLHIAKNPQLVNDFSRNCLLYKKELVASGIIRKIAKQLVVKE